MSSAAGGLDSARTAEALDVVEDTEVVHHEEALKDVLSSIVGSAACVYTGQPLDTVKVRMQARPDAFNGTFQCLRKTIAEEPVSALWKGSTPALSGAVMENMVAFSVNQQLKRLFPEQDGQAHPWWQPIMWGGVTGIFTSAVLCPNDVIKCKVQVSRSLKQQAKDGIRAMNASQMTKHILRTQGLPGLFVGLSAQFARDIPFYASFFGTYDICMDYLTVAGAPDELSYLTAGGLAGVMGWAVCMPIDVVKSVIQTAEKPKGMLATMQDIIRVNGVRRLYSGLSPALIRAFPANAALFLGYEIVRRNL